jgi:superoxide dismutase, Fe-Mn family
MKNEQTKSRRDFLRTGTKAALAAGLTIPAITALSNNSERAMMTGADNSDITWRQQPLSYLYTSLEPAIDAMTMEIHYNKHAAGYAKNLADAAKEENVNTASVTMEQLLADISKYSFKMRNNAGGHYNHELFWKSLRTPATGNSPTGKLSELITRDFNSFDSFKSQFSDAAKNRFGSGWAWLVYTNDRKLVVTSTPNQDNPLMNIADIKGFPVLGLDVWEHAYYLKYQNKRPDYINAWWAIINWNYIQKRFTEI